MKAKTYLAVMEPCETGYGGFSRIFPGVPLQERISNRRQKMPEKPCPCIIVV